MGRKRRDVTGKKFNKLTAVKDVGADKYGHRIWLCRCDCSNTTVVKLSLIIHGRTKSCGCLSKFPKGEAVFNSLYTQYKRRAKNRGYKFTLSKNEFRELTKQNCHYCGTEPKQERRLGQRFNGSYTYNGVDRVNNAAGYVIENCVPCCGVCNGMKMAQTREEFLNHITKILEHNMETSLV